VRDTGRLDALARSFGAVSYRRWAYLVAVVVVTTFIPSEPLALRLLSVALIFSAWLLVFGPIVRYLMEYHAMRRKKARRVH
jgi:hypothetical protein